VFSGDLFDGAALMMDEFAVVGRLETVTLFSTILSAAGNVIVTPVTRREGALRVIGA